MHVGCGLIHISYTYIFTFLLFISLYTTWNYHGRKHIYTWTNAGWASCWGCGLHVSLRNVDQVYLSTSILWPRGPVPPGSIHHSCSVLLDDGADIRFAVQAAFAAYSVPAQSDKFYDLAGSLGFISTTLVSLVRLLPFLALTRSQRI
jgi:hypothetical protein